MSNDNEKSLCEQVDESIEAILDGDADGRLFEHISGCDRCRDLRHDAAIVREHLRTAGADYVHPADFETRLLQKLGEASQPTTEAASPPAAEVTAPAASAAIEAGADKPADQPPEEAKGQTQERSPVAEALQSSGDPGSVSAPAEVTSVVAEPKAETAAAKVGSLGFRLGAAIRGRSAKVVVLSVAGLAAIAAGVVLSIQHRTHHTSGAGVMSTGPWDAKIVSIARASSDSAGGLEVCKSDGTSCASASRDGVIPAGSLVRTDLRTRAHLELSDGSRMAMDRGTELMLAASGPRKAKIARGALVADFAHLDNGPDATLDLPWGRVEIIGTKIAVAASQDRSTVEVVRGVVHVVDGNGTSVTVRSGEEGILERGRSPEVGPAAGIANSVAWSERAESRQEEETVVRGLGELKARKPGETSERNQAVRLAKHDLKVRVADAVARTEIDETFTNDTGDVLEGIYRFPLPPDAQIERLALEVNGKLEDGAFVDKERAAAIWRGVIHNAAPKAPKPREEIIWVPGPWRDPALLEWQRGGRFELRIFPIPAHGSRRVVLAYTQTVPAVGGLRRYTYPLSHDPAGSTRAGEFNADVQVNGFDPSSGVLTHGYEMNSQVDRDRPSAHLTMNAKSFVPSGDMTVEYALSSDKQEATAWAYKPAATQSLLPKDSDSPYVAIALRPKLPRWTEGRLRDQIVVVDSSRSMVGERFGRATRLAEAVVREMDKQDRVTVMACDTECRVMSESRDADIGLAPGPAASQRVHEFLSHIQPDGASDLVGAVRQALKRASGRDRQLHIVYIGDGSPSVGAIRPSHVSQEVARLMTEGTGTLSTVAVGSDADSHVLSAMARGGGGVMIPYLPGEQANSVAMQVLGASYGMTIRNPVAELPEGLSDVYPKQLDTMRAGGESWIVARMTSPEVNGNIRLRGKVGGDSYDQTYRIKILASSSEGNAFVPRMYAATKIVDLEATQGEKARQELIDLSKRFAVASSYTSLLVLESPAMFKAFGVDRAEHEEFTWSGESSTESTGADGEREYEAKDESSLDRVGGGAPPAKKSPKGGGFSPYAADPFDPSAGAGVGASVAAPKSRAAGPSPTPRPAGNARGDSLMNPYGGQRSGHESKAEAESPRSAPTSTMAVPPPTSQPGFIPPRDNRGRNMVPMRRVWDRSGVVITDLASLKSAVASKLSQLENDFSSNGDSRTRLEALLGAYEFEGRLDRAGDLAERWSTKDALDSSALIARARVAARQGQRAKAIHILDGLADLRPADSATRNWLASMFESAGDASRACGHRIALAELRPNDGPSLAAAIRCARSTGSNGLADTLLSETTKDTLRSQVDRELAKTVEAALKGDVQIDASWDADVDIDVALIGKNGERYSWLGEPKGRVSSRGGTARRSESIAMLNAPAGDYIIEVARAETGDSSSVRGTVHVRAVGAVRDIPFVLNDGRVEVGAIKIQYTPRLEPVSTPVW